MKRLLIFLCFETLFSCAQNKMGEAYKLKDEASVSLDAEEYPQAIDKARLAKTIFEKNKDTLGIVESLYIMARASALSGDFEHAIPYGEKGKKLCLLKENYAMEYKINNTLSWAYFALDKDFFKILEHQERQLYVVNQLEDEGAKASAYNNYGYDTTVSGSIALDSAITLMQFANNHYAKTENNKGRWYTLMNLTWQYRLKNDLEKSAYFGKLSAKRAKEDNDRHAIVEANTNFGETLLHQNKLEEAAPYYVEALKWAEQNQDRDKYVFDVYYSRYLWQKGDKAEALKLLKKAITFLETSEVFYEMLGRAFLATYSYETNDYDEAKKQLAVFENPRSEYISVEARILAKLVEAKMLFTADRKRARVLLEDASKQLRRIGAKQLLNLVQQVQKMDDTP
ncbi:hypothetical protein [Ulvibacterium sp.]|uniref:hypothetical protein n=1 Tax=Ulvibacterium sp. TaxID=2665914 RepID=UPI0026157998|nr:hypothetical protein [Ulvibacterium sp.]